MSLYYNQTNQTPGTSQFITRAEVIAGFSTLVSDLSGGNFNISSIFNNPNPVVSSLTIANTGVIANAAVVQAQRHIVSTGVGAITGVRPFFNNNLTTLGAADQTGGTFNDFAAKNFVAEIGNTNATTNFRVEYGYNGLRGVYGSTVQTLASYTPLPATQSANSWALTNVSTINGVPVLSNFTSYTTITGTNINNTGVINTPSLVALSSLNALPYPPPQVLASTITASNAITTQNLNVSGTAAVASLVANQLAQGNRSMVLNAVGGQSPMYVACGYDTLNAGGSLVISTVQGAGSMVFATAISGQQNFNISVQPIAATQAGVYSQGGGAQAGQPVWWLTIGR